MLIHANSNGAGQQEPPTEQHVAHGPPQGPPQGQVQAGSGRGDAAEGAGAVGLAPVRLRVIEEILRGQVTSTQG